MRMIDADALKAEIQRRRKRYKTLTGVDMAMLVDDAPTVDVAKDTNVPNKLISVKDGLPTQQGEYLVNVIQYCLGGFELAWFDGKVWTAADGEEYTDNSANDDNTIGKVTHWMTIPNPPKEDEA